MLPIRHNPVRVNREHLVHQAFEAPSLRFGRGIEGGDVDGGRAVGHVDLAAGRYRAFQQPEKARFVSGSFHIPTERQLAFAAFCDGLAVVNSADKALAVFQPVAFGGLDERLAEQLVQRVIEPIELLAVDRQFQIERVAAVEALQTERLQLLLHALVRRHDWITPIVTSPGRKQVEPPATMSLMVISYS